MSTHQFRFAALGAVFLIFSAGTVVAQQRMTPWQYNAKEAQNAFAGFRSIQASGWGPLNARVLHVQSQLVEYSHQVYRVIPAQNFDWGSAHAGGWILLDISSATASDEVLAFRLAHEWGHQALGQQPNFFHPMGRGWAFQSNSTQDEDDADTYAGKFLATYHYALEPVLRELRSMPASPAGDSHSDGAMRARIVERAFDSVAGGSGQQSDPEPDPPATRQSNRPHCIAQCGQVKQSCRSTCSSAYQECFQNARGPEIYMCQCPNWPVGNFGCYNVCVEFSNAVNACASERSSCNDECEESNDDCKQACGD
jgi:hypothetical protein